MPPLNRTSPTSRPRLRSAAVVAVIVALFPTLLPAATTHIQFRRIGFEQGLAQLRINCVHQDRTGFIWLGTGDGLVRYDANAFVVFRPDPASTPNDPPDFSVRTIHEDDDGALWVGGINNGFSKFDPSTRTFVETYRYDSEKPQWLESRSVLSIHAATDGQLWLGTDWGGLHRFDPATQKLDHFPIREPSPANTNQGVINSVFQSPSDPNTVWLGTAWGGLIKLDPHTGETHRFVDDPPSAHELAPPQQVTEIIEGSPGALWVTATGSNPGLYKFDTRQNKFITVHLYNNPENPEKPHGLTSVLKDAAGTIWVASDTGGIASLDPETGQFKPHLHDPSDLHSISHNRVRSLFQDRGGIVWVATHHSGLSTFDPDGDWQHHHQFGPPLNVTSILPGEEDDQIVWFGSDRGLGRWDRRDGSTLFFRHNLDDPAGIDSDHVNALARRAAGGFWIATIRGLNHYDPVSHRVVRFQPSTESARALNSIRINAIKEDQLGRLWLGVNPGLLLYNPKSGELQRIKHDPADQTSIPPGRVTKILEDGKRTLWFALDLWGGVQKYGLARLSPGSEEFERYTHNPDDPLTLTDNRITALHVEPTTGRLWAGTPRGINRVSTTPSQEHSPPTISRSPGLLETRVKSIALDARGNLWLASNKGLFLMENPSSPQPHLHLVDRTVGSSLISTSSPGTALPSGSLLFGTTRGILEIQPSRYKIGAPPPVVITDFQIHRSPSTHDTPAHNTPQLSSANPGQLTVPHAFNTVMTFNFAALDFTAPGQNHFAYRLEGFDDTWRYDVTEPTATYSTLPPGKYEFQVKAANSTGVWNEQGASVALTILPPWWATWWFRALVAASLAGVCIAYIHYRTRRAVARATRLESEAKQREKLNQKLQISEQRFHNFIANSSEQVWCVELEKPIPLDLPERQQAEWILDHAYFAEANQTLADAYGATIEEVLTWRFEKVMPRSLPTTIPLFEEIARSGYRMVDFETQEVAKNGSQRIMLNNFIGTIKDGKVVRVWGTTRDVTDQRKAERAIQTNTLKLKAEVEKRTEAQEQLHDLASRLIHTQEHERRHVARELHDDLTQRLAAMAMDTKLAEAEIESSPERAHKELQEIQAELNEMATATQELSRQLHPKILEELGLAKALRAECRRFAKRTGVALNSEVEEIDGLDNDEKLCLYRILQEALANIGKHAKASSVRVTLIQDPTGVTLSIKDDGIGFDPTQLNATGSLGMVSMAERARLCRSALKIDSAQDSGTVVAVNLPRKNTDA